MDFDTYRALEGVNWSLLKHMTASPLHFRHAEQSEREDTNRLLLGRAVHTAVLEPDEFPLRYAVYEGAVRRGKEWDAFAEANADKDILKADEYRMCLSVRDAVRSHPAVNGLLDGTSEVVRQWTDAATGIDCKCRIDHVAASGALVDLKTTKSVDEREFMNTSARYLYHAQLAFYRRGMGEDVPAYVIAVELEPPHDVAVFEVTSWAMDAGDKLVTESLGDLKHCREEDRWPGRYGSVRELGLPAWMEDSEDASLGVMIGGVRA